MGHLRKSSTTGHLLKGTGGHLVNACGGEPYLLLPCYPFFVLEPCQGDGLICCANDFREFVYQWEDDGHLWAQNVLIVRNGQCYRVRWCEEEDGCDTPNVETGLKIWSDEHPAQMDPNYQWQDGDCDYVEPWGPDCNACPPKFGVGNHTCGGPGHGACTMSFGWNAQSQQWEAGIDYYGAGGSTPYGQDATFNIGICPYAGPPPGGCDDLVMKITWHDMVLDDWVEPLSRPINEKPTPPDCMYVFDGQIPYDRNNDVRGCILCRRLNAWLGAVVKIDQPEDDEDVPCYEVYSSCDDPEPPTATVYGFLEDCYDCC